jgi:DNA-binding CsgD family transcriptional regulator
MTASTTPSSRPSANGRSKHTECPRLNELIRKLVDQITTSVEAPAANPQARGGEEIIMDAVVDGSRYLLIRMSVPTTPLKSLTPREQEIVRMVAKGYPNKTIAGVLNISCWTVGTHLRRTFAKLGVASRAAMIARIMEEHPTWDHLPETEAANRTAAPHLKVSSARPHIARRPVSIENLP